MISIQISPNDIKKITKHLDSKIMSMKEINSPQSLTNIAKAAFTITGKDFLKNINKIAKTPEGRKRVGHMYEWNKSGINTQRLFILVRTRVNGGNLVISNKILKSKTPVPIKKRLQKPGPTGRTVTARNIFRDKASVMEAGSPVTIRARNKTIVFPNSDGGLTFIRKGQSIYVRNPGGRMAKGGYTKYQQQWFARNANKSMEESRIFDNIEKSVKRVLNMQNSKPADVRKVVAEICQRYSGGMTQL